MRKLRWALRRAFWNGLMVLSSGPTGPSHPGAGRRPAALGTDPPLCDRCPSIPIERIPVADHVPSDENSRARLRFSKFQAWLYRHFPHDSAGSPRSTIGKLVTSGVTRDGVARLAAGFVDIPGIGRARGAGHGPVELPALGRRAADPHLPLRATGEARRLPAPRQLQPHPQRQPGATVAGLLVHGP